MRWFMWLTSVGLRMLRVSSPWSFGWLVRGIVRRTEEFNDKEKGALMMRVA